MTWTRLDDSWTDSAPLANLDFAVRWHYLGMIQYCCRNGRHEGLIRLVDARRASDHPNPDSAITDLVSADLLERVGPGSVRILHIADHVPPPHVVEKKKKDAERKRRSRAHLAGDHSLCIFGSGCSEAPRPADYRETEDMSRDSHADYRDGTGRDRTGVNTGGDLKDAVWSSDAVWNVTPIPGSKVPA